MLTCGFSVGQTTPNRKKLKQMLDEDDQVDPGSPVKNLETKLSPYKSQLMTEIKGMYFPYNLI